MSKDKIQPPLIFELIHQISKDKIKSDLILDWINQLTTIHNQILGKESFSAGFNMCVLQQRMVDVHLELERQEKENK